MQQGAAENRVIYSDLCLSLQAVILPARSFNIFK